MRAYSSGRVTSFVSVSEMQCAGVRSYILHWYHPRVRHIHVKLKYIVVVNSVVLLHILLFPSWYTSVTLFNLIPNSATDIHQLGPNNTGLFISLCGNSDLCGTVTGMVTPKGNMSKEGETLQVSVLPYKCSICPPLVMRQMSNLAILANFKTQNGFLFPVHAMFRHDCHLAIKPASTPRCLVHIKNLERFSTYLYAPFCCVCLGCSAADFGSSGGNYE
jgi:hypothetical protein